ncbi:OmpA family protein [Enhygromyxa salina]|uniref:Putative outer membrane lipoprotein n=1 Tax=Enhygromyxa salina TaxID=215803 RepID=A0A2S9YYP4_9BACT|nr:OmpA family protein [Enhygromyxa salina]PRQ10197.1 putative outer membrane lipoprotein [Enhygromyxa salina]
MTLPGTHALGLGVLFTLFASACVSVPLADPVQFAVDDDQLRDAGAHREINAAAQSLSADPALHLLIVGHADEDNTEDYNRALSLRRAESVRARILVAAPDLEARVRVEARGEWDATDPGSDEQAKSRNRRVELRFYYPRHCEPSFDAAFLACEWSRLPEPPRAPAPEPAPDEPGPELEPEPAPPSAPSPRQRQDFRGPYLFGLGGYAISSGEYLRQHGRWGVGGGYLWGIGDEFRIALGMQFDHLIDVGFLFAQSGGCAPFCSRVDRSQIRVAPELRIGGARGGLWGWLRLSAGLVMQHNEARLGQEADQPEPVELTAARWDPGAVFGIGPGIAVTLTAHLFLLIDATVSYSVVPSAGGGGGGSGIYDAGAGLGWVF